ncbi:hypothetical protein J2Y63_002172 [Shinella sp. BE166]
MGAVVRRYRFICGRLCSSCCLPVAPRPVAGCHSCNGSHVSLNKRLMNQVASLSCRKTRRLWPLSSGPCRSCSKMEGAQIRIVGELFGHFVERKFAPEFVRRNDCGVRRHDWLRRLNASEGGSRHDRGFGHDCGDNWSYDGGTVAVHAQSSTPQHAGFPVAFAGTTDYIRSVAHVGGPGSVLLPPSSVVLVRRKFRLRRALEHPG